MKKLLFPALVLAALQAPAQTLFTVGNDSIAVQEFMYAYRKNNTGPHSAKALHDYLQLYISSKLKTKEARSLGYDTMPQFRADLAGLRSQILPAYLNDPEGLRQLTEEAFERSKKDVSVSHIFISLLNEAGDRDTAAALKKANEAYAQLNAGTPFATVARKYSDDPSVAENGGSLGYITVFALPYELETIAYNTAPGKLAPIYRSAVGYHIVKVDAVRNGLGRMRAAQILLAFPPNSTDAEKAALRKRADSIYTALKKGASFDAHAEQWSNDPVSGGAGGLMPEFGVGQYDPIFEKTAFALAKDNEISKPFETVHGIHILKRVKKIPLPTEKTEAVLQPLRDKVQASDRIKATQAALVQKVLQQSGYQPLPAAMKAALESRTRRALQNNLSDDALSGETVLFRLGGMPYTVDHWINYARNFRVKEDGSGDKPFAQLWDEYLEVQAMDHYSQHLENYNPEFRNQMAEFREGNLFFEIMQRQIWTPVQADTAGLRSFYEQNKNRYLWQRSADAVVFYPHNAADARKLAAQVQQSPAQWRRLTEAFGDVVTTDSARFEWGSLPGSKQLPFKRNVVSKVQTSEADGSATFALVLQVYTQPLQRSFDEARGAVINDYQALKEKEWLEGLRKKYPVWINEAELQKLAQQKK